MKAFTSISVLCYVAFIKLMTAANIYAYPIPDQLYPEIEGFLQRADIRRSERDRLASTSLGREFDWVITAQRQDPSDILVATTVRPWTKSIKQRRSTISPPQDGPRIQLVTALGTPDQSAQSPATSNVSPSPDAEARIETSTNDETKISWIKSALKKLISVWHSTVNAENKVGKGVKKLWNWLIQKFWYGPGRDSFYIERMKKLDEEKEALLDRIKKAAENEAQQTPNMLSMPSGVSTTPTFESGQRPMMEEEFSHTQNSLLKPQATHARKPPIARPNSNFRRGGDRDDNGNDRITTEPEAMVLGSNSPRLGSPSRLPLHRAKYPKSETARKPRFNLCLEPHTEHEDEYLHEEKFIRRPACYMIDESIDSSISSLSTDEESLSDKLKYCGTSCTIQ